jgi:hypothetical protein
MNIPEWVKPALQGAAAGAVALAIVGFTWGGWVTGGTAREMADDHAKAEVVAALVPICIEQSKADPKVEDTLMRLKETTSYQRSSMLMETGWATMPGSTQPNRNVAIACLDSLSKEF